MWSLNSLKTNTGPLTLQDIVRNRTKLTATLSVVLCSWCELPRFWGQTSFSATCVNTTSNWTPASKTCWDSRSTKLMFLSRAEVYPLCTLLVAHWTKVHHQTQILHNCSWLKVAIKHKYFIIEYIIFWFLLFLFFLILAVLCFPSCRNKMKVYVSNRSVVTYCVRI